MASSRARSKSFGSSHDLVMEGWEAKENHDGIVYFVHNQIKITSWIHPYVNKVFEELGHYNDIKYAAYRTAMKMRFLQVKLGFSWISIEGVKKVFSNIPVTEDCSGIEDLFSCREAFSVVHCVLEMSDSLRLHRNHLIHASEVILNLLLEIYDTTRSGKLAKRSVRIALVALCSAKLSDKYRFFFNEISNVRGHIQREKFLFFVYDLMQITELLKESTAFGTNVSAAVNSCLNGSGDHSPSESSQDTFYSWLLQEPQTLIWLPTLHRVIATENIQHNVQCSVCNTQPLIGFRYRCMQCLSYDLCQSCFFRGCISLSHRSKHPMQEYCLPTTRKDNTKALLKIVRNKVSKRHRQSKIKFLPVDDDSITGSVFQWQPRSLIPDPRGSFHSSTDSGLAVCSSSGNCEFQVMGPADQMDANDIAMMKKWCKPVEVLGEPYDASSPCLQQETLSKKNMDGQQRKMSQTIQQLQEENRILRQKLSALRKREIEDDEEKFNLSEETVNVVLEDKNYSGDPLKEITTDGPISPIKSVSVTDGLSTTVDPFRADKEYGLKDQNISINVLNIVGSCTPIATLLYVENKESTDSNESGINEDGGVYSDDLSISSSKLTRNRVEADDNFEMEKCEIHNSEPLINQPVFALQMYTDTETESTTSNDLEYTLSDMSLMSEAPSRARSTRSEQVGLKMLAWPVDKVKVAEEDVSKTDRITTNDATTDYCNNTSAYTYISPNTTKNETTELDAFKLCRMKFDSTDGPCKKLDRQDSSSSGSQPRLIYTSSSKRNKHPLKNGHHNFRAEPCQVDKIAIVNETNRTQSQLHASNYASFDLSEIPTQGSTAFVSNGTKRSYQPRDSGRRKTPEPVFMSTPVTNDVHFVPWKSALRKKSASVKVNRKRQEKENRAPSFGGNSTEESVLYTEKELSVYSATPKSSIPSWQRQRILRTMDRLQSNRSYSCNDLTTGGEMGMTTMFANAEHCRTLGEGCSSLPLEDKEELDRMIDRINIEDSQRSDLPVCHDASNSSMLQAVLNIGDAMADFVQATAEVQMQKESDHF